MKKYIMKKLLKYAPGLVAGHLRNCINIEPNRMKEFQFKIAGRTEELEAAYKLVHDQYVKSGYMHPSLSGIRLNIHNLLPQTTTFVGQSNGDTMITLTIFQDSELGLPMDVIYKNEIDILRSRGRRLAEIGALASHPAYRNGDHNIPMCGNKIMYLYATQHLNIDDFVIAIHPKHEWFYKHILLFEKIGIRKDYEYDKNAPAVAYHLDLKKAKQRFKIRYDGKPDRTNLYKFFILDKHENLELPSDNQVCCIWDRNKVDYFFRQKTSILEETDEDTRKCLSRYCDYLS